MVTFMCCDLLMRRSGVLPSSVVRRIKSQGLAAEMCCPARPACGCTVALYYSMLGMHPLTRPRSSALASVCSRPALVVCVPCHIAPPSHSPGAPHASSHTSPTHPQRNMSNNLWEGGNALGRGALNVWQNWERIVNASRPTPSAINPRYEDWAPVQYILVRATMHTKAQTHTCLWCMIVCSVGSRYGGIFMCPCLGSMQLAS